MCRRDLHPDATWLPLSRRRHGLGQQKGPRLAAVKHAGRRLFVAALEEAIARHGSPEIFNTDQGSQFTSFGFTAVLAEAGVRISMDGRGRCMDNIFIERLWRSMKYECVYLNAFETGLELRAGLTRWISYYNTARPHSALAGRTPDEAYDGGAQVGTAERQLAA